SALATRRRPHEGGVGWGQSWRAIYRHRRRHGHAPNAYLGVAWLRRLLCAPGDEHAPDDSSRATPLRRGGASERHHRWSASGAGTLGGAHFAASIRDGERRGRRAPSTRRGGRLVPERARAEGNDLDAG